jgi:DNA-binding CsgD family transcriptional regulator
MSEEPGSNPNDLAALLLRIAQNSATCTTAQDFSDLIRQHVRRLLPHTSLIAVLGRIDLEHLELLHVEGVDYPAHGLAALQRQTNLRNRPALMRWLKARAPIVLDPELDGVYLSAAERQEIELLQLGRVAAHGVLDLVARSGSYFSFGGIPKDLPAHEVTQHLMLLVPHLHQALAACHPATRVAGHWDIGLTEAEREVLRWVAAGRTNAEIALLRGTSEATVRNQLTATFKKLGVNNRAAAVRLQSQWA